MHFFFTTNFFFKVSGFNTSNQTKTDDNIVYVQVYAMYSRKEACKQRTYIAYTSGQFSYITQPQNKISPLITDLKTKTVPLVKENDSL